MNKFLFVLSKYFPNFSEKLYCKWLKIFVKSKDFTIISNNCWGGGIYENMNLQYNSPTVGLFFYAPCYIKFLSNLKENLSKEIEFVSKSIYEEANEDREKRNLNYPIGKIDDIEIHFLHYKSEIEALEKWKRRALRVNFNKLFVKFCDRDLCTLKEIEQFSKLNLQNKVFFSSKKLNLLSFCIYLEDYKENCFVGSLYEHPWMYRKKFSVVNWLNRN